MFNRNFIILLLGRVITNFADSLYFIAGMWLVYELTQNPFYTGLAGFLIGAPLLLQFLIGPLIDKWDLKKILIYTQLIQGVLLLCIPLMHFIGILNVAIVLTVMPLISLIQQFTYPTQSAVLPKIVEDQYLVKSNSIMAIAYQGLDIIFTIASGVIIFNFGVINIFILSILLFFSSTLLYSFIQIPGEYSGFEGMNFKSIYRDYTQELNKGYQFIKNSFIPKFLVGSIVANFLLGAVTANLPSYAAYRGSEIYYTYFLAALSIGLLVGSVFANLLSRFDLGKVTIIGFALSGIFGYLAVISPNIYFSIIFVGLCQIIPGATGILFLSVLQKNLPDNYLGRVFSIINSFTMVAAPLGALMGGIIISVIGSEYLLHLIMISMFFVSLYWIIVPSLRKLPNINILDAKEYGLTVER